MYRKKIKLIKDVSLSKFLFEQEDLFGDEAEEGGDEAEEETEEEGGEEAEEGAEETEGEEEEEVEVTPDEEVKLSKSIDADLEALLIDFETQARKTKEIETSSAEEFETAPVEESLKLSMLIEQDESGVYEEEIDLDRFTAEVARLVKNYTNLLDMEKMIINKSREFIVSRYGEEAEQELLDKLSMKHDIDIDEPTIPRETDLEVPVAVGASATAAAEG